MVLALLLAVGATACPVRPAEPERPAKVPEKAFWVGGYDGGVFVLLSAAKPNRPMVHRARIFHPDGDVWYEGPLELDRGPPLDLNDRSQFSAWVGEALVLRDGRVLNRPKLGR